MSPKQNPKSRRKNCAPKRVIHEDAEEKFRSNFPQDPALLAKYILDHPVTKFFKLPIVPQFSEIVKKAQEEAATNGQEVVFKCNTCAEKVYRSSAGLHYHLMNSCPGVDLCLTCIICGKKMYDSGKMVEHIQGKSFFSLHFTSFKLSFQHNIRQLKPYKLYTLNEILIVAYSNSILTY